ncbi:hypothetical protein [Thiothrix nivea]|uniref:Uncharacterized protein n=1 Tax=Thiothrix nivea (strain ATCC 35100 / DSM 5205 / JP2) TaxID=870187 RepID=A0A656HBX0_THINJ|nr:hypothetical protein [Thiothrix nivea]EIJ33484.1 hypothetical protein Thini_0856 [Thiothrix nivea DSM 5205]
MAGFWVVMVGVLACAAASIGAFTWCKRNGRLKELEHAYRQQRRDMSLGEDMKASRPANIQ